MKKIQTRVIIALFLIVVNISASDLLGFAQELTPEQKRLAIKSLKDYEKKMKDGNLTEDPFYTNTKNRTHTTNKTQYNKSINRKNIDPDTNSYKKNYRDTNNYSDTNGNFVQTRTRITGDITMINSNIGGIHIGK